MIEQISAFFTIEMIYLWLNIGVLPFWFILLFFPKSKICNFFVTSVFPIFVLSSIYIYLIYKFFISGYNFFDQKYSDKYLYKIVSELTSGKIDFSEFKSEFQKLVFYLDNSQKVIKKIFVTKDSKEIILSSS